MTEQVLDIRGWVRLIRRFWRTVAVFVVAGVLAASAYELWGVPHYRATSLVLLPAPASNGSGTPASTHDATTDARVALSGAVLVPAGRSVDRSLSLQTLQSRVTAAATATSVLRITASGTSSRQAEALANAVADQLVTFVASNGSVGGSNVVAALHAEARQLQSQIADVKAQLQSAQQRLAADSATSTRHQDDANLAATLSNEVSSLSLQLNGVKSQTSQAALEEVAANQGTEVIQRATTATAPSATSLALPLALGALGGLFVGSLVVLTWHRRDPRLRSRDALAEAVGAPVVASLAVPTRRTAGDWIFLFEQYQPSALEQWTVRRALREVGVGEDRGRRLTVLAFAGDPAGVAHAAHVALAMAASGNRTVFVATADDDESTPLRAACAKLSADSRESRANLRVLERVATADDGAADLVVEAVVLDPNRAAPDRAGRPGTAVALSVSAGFASAEQLAATAIAAADGGGPVTGVLVANPTSADHTVGRFADASAGRSSLRSRRAPATHPEASAGRVR